MSHYPDFNDSYDSWRLSGNPADDFDYDKLFVEKEFYNFEVNDLYEVDFLATLVRGAIEIKLRAVNKIPVESLDGLFTQYIFDLLVDASDRIDSMILS